MTKFDPLDMHNYRIEKLPKREKSKFEKWLVAVGPILAIIIFILFAFVLKLPFLYSIGFAGVAMAACLQRQGLDVGKIGAFMGAFYLPWAFKWPWA